MTIKSSQLVKYFVSSLILSFLFLNACKKGTSDISPSLTDICLIAKRTQFDAKDKLTNEDTYSYNNKRQVSSIKYFSTGTDGSFTNTDSYQYNSDGQVTKITSSNSTYSYVYDNKRLIEENVELDRVSLSYKYSYDTHGKKIKLIFKSIYDNKISKNYEEAYEYQDTLLIKTKRRSFVDERQTEILDLIYKYDENRRLIEEQVLNSINSQNTMTSYKYDTYGNIIKKTQKRSDSDTIQEELFTYLNNKLVEKIMSFTNKKGETDPIYKTVIEYKQDNISKKTHFGNGELTAYELYTYTCDK